MRGEMMIIVMNKEASAGQIDHVIARIEQLGCRVDLSRGEERTIIGVIGNGRPLDREQIERWDGVSHTVPILKPFKLASRDFHPANTIVSVGDVQIGGNEVVVMAGPCSVESQEQILDTARQVKQLVQGYCVGALINHAHRLTASRVWGRKDWNFWRLPNKKQECRLSRKLWSPRWFPW